VLGLAEQYSNNIDFLQLATFNDFGEGTMFEPTIETGFEYLKQVQQFTGVTFGEAELQLVYRLYLARKKYFGNASIQANLDAVSDHLAALDIPSANDLLSSTALAGDYDADGDIDASDYAVWRSAFGSETILRGSGADGNYDGMIDAADYLVWRKSHDDGAASAAAAVAAVPEPATGAIFGILAITVCYCRMRRPPRMRPVALVVGLRSKPRTLARSASEVIVVGPALALRASVT
jgi:hypothetical protein